MMHINNWQSQANGLPHNPALNGLRYLYHFPIQQASQMMTDPQWTRAIFVRDPKERFLSAYLDKAVDEELFFDTCCHRNRPIYCKTDDPTLAEFAIAIQACPDSHWNPQSDRMERKYWPYINFVGHMETLQDDARKLLQKINAWEKYGKSGWGPSNSLEIFAGKDGRHHAQNAKNKVQDFYYPELEHTVEKFYESDYKNIYLNMTDNRKFNEHDIVVDLATTELPHFVEPRDYIYRDNPPTKGSEASPVVIEKYKLVFFVANYNAQNYFKALLRRMSGKQDWNKVLTMKDFGNDDFSNKMNDGLKFLSSYNLSQASEIMTSPEWTRAMFIRDPKEYFILSYVDSVHRNRMLLKQVCCRNPPKKFCVKNKRDAVTKPVSITEFIDGIFYCKDPHWNSQVERIARISHPGKSRMQITAMEEFSFHDNKYWKYINFIGHMDTVAQDTKALLTEIGAWDEFGKSGWGVQGQDVAIFTDNKYLSYQKRQKEKVRQYITSAEVEREIDAYLEPLDYKSPYLNITKRMLYRDDKPKQMGLALTT